MDSSVSFGNWLRQRRKALDWTQSQLAERVGCSLALIRKLEADERRPSKQIAGILAQILDLPPKERKEFLAFARGTNTLRPLPPHNLPADQTHFIGRKSELELLQTRITTNECRLLVLTGLGGIGKSRLAIQAARDVVQQFPDGVFFLNLAGLDSADHLVSTVASALSFSFHSMADSKTQLLHHLHTQKLLLIFDNYEHLLPRTELISEIIGTTSDIKIMVTSRERLNVQEEWIFPVKGLSYPQFENSNDHEFDTVRLFQQRATQVASSQVLTENDRPYILRIGVLAQGIPLAIEMAAAWTRMLSCKEIAEAIEQNLEVLSTELHNIPERHRSMNAVFEHSWKRLSEEERIAFMRLSIFRGGFTQEAAQNVGKAELPLLLNLLDKSFIWRSEKGRFAIHDLLRRFGEARLNGLPDKLADTQATFVGYFGKLLEDLRNPMWEPRHKQAVADVKGEIDNIRYAWNLASIQYTWMFFGQSAESLWQFYNTTNLFEEGVTLFQQGITVLAPLLEYPAHASALAQLFHGAGWFLQRLGRPVEAKSLVDKSLELLRESKVDDPHTNMVIKGSACTIALMTNDLEEAENYAEEIMASGKQSGDRLTMAAGHYFSGAVSRLTSNVATSKMHLVEAIRYLENYGSQWINSYVLRELGQVEFSEANFMSARTHLEESVSTFKDFGDIGNSAATLVLLGTTYFKIGDSGLAVSCYYEALEQSTIVHALSVTLDALVEIALLLLRESELATASYILRIVQAHPEIRHDIRLRIDGILMDLNGTILIVPDNEVEADNNLEQAIALAWKVENLLHKAG
jgi:transcriptional regulator with XRE-family HTH domain/tetratricopeptide (TPR) repeat protein